jgi:hypothetical protein
LGFEVLINGKNVVFIWFKSLLFSQKSIYFNFCRMVTKFLSSIPWNLCFYVLDYAHIIKPLQAFRETRKLPLRFFLPSTIQNTFMLDVY